MIYNEFQYLFPPRPIQAISPTILHTMENRKYVAQIKKNGTCSIIFVSPDKKITAMNRHNEIHKAWYPSGDVMKSFENIVGDGWYVFAAELLHNKVKDIRNINYVHDVLVNNGKYLVGVSQEDRQDMLHDIFNANDIETEDGDTHVEIDDHLWLPIEYESGFAELYRNLSKDEDEGLVLKDTKQTLALCTREASNTIGQLKCRKSHSNYSF